VEELNSLLLSPMDATDKCKEEAARAIANISVPIENRVPLMQSGVVEGLKVLLSSGTVKGKETAACGHCKYFVSSETQCSFDAISGVVEGLNSLLLSPIASATDKCKEEAARVSQILPFH